MNYGLFMLLTIGIGLLGVGVNQLASGLIPAIMTRSLDYLYDIPALSGSIKLGIIFFALGMMCLQQFFQWSSFESRSRKTHVNWTHEGR